MLCQTFKTMIRAVNCSAPNCVGLLHAKPPAVVAEEMEQRVQQFPVDKVGVQAV